MKPSVGRVVHYVSYGTPKGEYQSTCRAAIVTSVAATDDVPGKDDDVTTVSLAVLNPTGIMFNVQVQQSEFVTKPGTWHWPERV